MERMWGKVEQHMGQTGTFDTNYIKMIHEVVSLLKKDVRTVN